MIYFVNPSTLPVREAIKVRPDLGIIATPNSVRESQWVESSWIADNGCFTKAWNSDKWWAFLAANQGRADCLFATSPDVVGDAAATLEVTLPWLPKIRSLGYRAGFVAQDGQDNLPVPWDEFDALFLGGTTEFKLGEGARALTEEALSRNKHVHMGRVNSRKRLRLAHSWGCHSVDGTYLVFGPSVNLPKLMGWLDELPSMESTSDAAEKKLVGWFDLGSRES